LKLKLGILVVLVIMSTISGFNNGIVSNANARTPNSLAIGLQDGLSRTEMITIRTRLVIQITTDGPGRIFQLQ
jgi:hypothetical protein